jgi:hypothetical protein
MACILKNMEKTPTQELVEQLQDEAKCEGSGSFTIDLRRAAEEIEGLENQPGLYLLKLVQAAVAANCREIRIRLGRRQVEFEALGSNLFSPEDVWQALEGPFQALPPAVEHLAWALFLARPVGHLRLGLPGAGYDSEGGWQAEEFAHGMRLCLQRSGSWFHYLAGLALRSHEHLLLYERCAYAPVPIRLDGRLVNNPNRLDGWVPRGVLKPPSLLQFELFHRYKGDILVERNLLQSHGARFTASLPSARVVRNLTVGEDEYEVLAGLALSMNMFSSPVMVVQLCQWLHEGPEWLVTEWEKAEKGTYPLARGVGLSVAARVLAVPQETIQSYLSEIPAGVPYPYNQEPSWLNKNQASNFERDLPLVNLRLFLPLGLEGPSRLLLIRHGVALDPCPGPNGYPGLVVVATHENLRSDLSQLRVVQDDVVAELQGQARQHAAAMVEDFWQVASQVYPDWVLRHIKSRLPGS